MVFEPSTGVRVWLDTRRLDCRQGLCSLDEQTASPDGAGRQGFRRVDYDCTGLRTRDTGAAGWRPVAANSLSEALLTFACTFQQRKDELGDAKALDADGRSFQRVADLVAGAVDMRPVHGATLHRAPMSASAGVGNAVQVAAAPSETEAEGELQRLQARQADLMSGLSTRVVAAESRGRKVFRALVVGFADFDAAQRFCTALKARQLACFVRPVA